MNTHAEKLAYAIQALKDICNPIACMERTMPAGVKLDGRACEALIDNPMTYRDLARLALQEMGEWDDRGRQHHE